MICLIQRVSQAKVFVRQNIIGKIGPGLLVLTAFQPDDTSQHIDRMVHKLLHYRLFADENDKMNLNIQEVKGSFLLVPQFTLAANTQKGLRPSFSSSASPAIATLFFDEFVDKMRTTSSPVQTGQFGTDMQVTSTNDGPVTFWLQL